MFYEEQVVDEVLCYRSEPDGKFVPFTPQELTLKLMTMQLSHDQASSGFWKAYNRSKTMIPAILELRSALPYLWICFNAKEPIYDRSVLHRLESALELCKNDKDIF